MNIDFKHIAIATALALPLAACSQDTSKAAGSSSTSMADAAKDMGGKMADSAKQFTAQFDDMKKMADTKMSGVDSSVADLKAKAAAKTGEAKTQMEGLMKQLTAKKDEIAKMFAGVDMKSIDMKAIEGLKAKVEPMLAELQKLLDKAKTM